MTSLLIVVGIALMAVVAGYHRWLGHGRQRTAPPEPARWPRVAVLRPIRGLDPGARENLDALLELDYPGELETVFLLDDEDDPSYPFVRDAIAAHADRRARIVLTGEPPPHRTGKIHKMILGAELSHADVLAFSDSDTRPLRHQLRELVALMMADDHCGIAFAPTVAVAHESAIGDVGYALLVNAWYGAALDRIVGPHDDVPFAMGQFMLIRRSALDAIGTMRAAEGELVDDMFLGNRMIANGYTNLVGPTRVPIAIGGMTLVDFVKIFRKWLFFSHSGLPASFKRAGWMRAVPGLSAWAMVVAGVVLASVPVVATGVAALVVFTGSQLWLSRDLGGAVVSPRHYWLAAALPFLATGVAASTKLSHEVSWRGRRYRLDHAGRLAAAPR
jgi:ceramide glucosyltransferase